MSIENLDNYENEAVLLINGLQQRVGFNSFSEVQAASVASDVDYLTVKGVTFKRGNLPTAFQSADGASWGPFPNPTPEHFETPLEFEEAMLADGFVVSDSTDTSDAPSGKILSPYIWTTLKDPELDLKDFVIPSNLLADGDHNSQIIDDVISWLSRRTNGATLKATGFSQDYPNPVVVLAAQSYVDPDGGPDIIAGFRARRRVNLDFRGMVLRAGEAMDAMMCSTDLKGSANEIAGSNSIHVAGGIWNANYVAQSCWWFRALGDSYLGTGYSKTKIQNALRSGIRIGAYNSSGDGTGSGGNGIHMKNLNMTKGLIHTSDAVAAIEIGSGISDSSFCDIDTNGYTCGIFGGVYISRVENFHAWSYPPRWALVSEDAGAGSPPSGYIDGATIGVPGYFFDNTRSGPLKYGFEINGGNVTFIDCQVDNPWLAAWKFGSGANHILVAPSVTLADDESDGIYKLPTTATVPVFEWTGNKKIQIFGLRENDRAASVHSAIFAPSCGLDNVTGFGFARYRGGSGTDGTGEYWHLQEGVDMSPDALDARYVPQAVTSDVNLTITDVTGNVSSSVIPCKMRIRGDEVRLTHSGTVTNVSNVTSGAVSLVGAEEVRIILPHTLKADHNASGNIVIGQIISEPNSGRSFSLRAVAGTNRATIYQEGGPSATPANITWTNAGSSMDILSFDITYIINT